MLGNLLEQRSFEKQIGNRSRHIEDVHLPDRLEGNVGRVGITPFNAFAVLRDFVIRDFALQDFARRQRGFVPSRFRFDAREFLQDILQRTNWFIIDDRRNPFRFNFDSRRGYVCP